MSVKVSFLRRSILFIAALAVCGNICAQGQTRNLDYYITEGLKNSPLLKDYGYQVLTNRLDSQKVRAGAKPQVNGTGQVYYAPGINGYGYDPAITNGGTYMAVVGATQQFLNRAILKAQYNNISILGQSLQNEGKLNEHDLQRSITAAYLTVYADYTQLANTQHIYNLLKGETEVMKPLVQHGIIKQSAYVAFSLEFQSQDISVKQLKLQYRSDLASLNILCGINDTTVHPVEAPNIIRNQLKYTYLNSPLFEKYRLDSMRILTEKRLVDVRYKPKLDWAVDAGIISSSPSTMLQHTGMSFGLGASVPIFDGHQRKLDYQKLDLSERTRSSYASYFKNQYSVRVQQLNSEYAATQELLEEVKQQLKTSESLIDMSRRELNTGDISVTDFIIFIRSNIDLRSSLTQAQIKSWQLTNEINYWTW